MDTARLATTLRTQTTRFAAAVTAADPTLVVPTCPDWRVRDLAAHVGQADRWAAGIVRTGVPAPIPDPADADPGDQAAWAKWLAEGAEELIDAVRTTGPDTAVWTLFGSLPAVFWLRRMVSDTTVHRIDASLAAGIVASIDDDLARDVVDEGLELLTAPTAADLLPALANLRGDGQTLAFVSPTAHPWHLTRTPDGVTRAHDRTDADVVVTASTPLLLSVITRRTPPTRATVTGDAALLDHWLAHTSF
ncbi:maleylpyruvate isomerase family mycothiol-dependent enzyme [Saccharothrix violaceirubra]|uniref:Uncharacterized protein (TIGR03083 family) n=1 Tax=Saccharothrix violaceirubra TaxID=413306 RepID=A0A7W7T0D4_9PSEU|nr:maleylpyruvate isomerase family mycothiol-dependent enzyme [Saccharothrix violaceirubra]MBB4964268.1 uncharacterized protein (TIGR03083 family) [Saccharothrix violaceirubra]